MYASPSRLWRPGTSTRRTLQGHVRDTIDPGSAVYTTPFRPTPDSTRTSTIAPSITLSPTWTGTSTRTSSRTSGRCWSAACTAPTSALSRFTLFRYLDERMFTFNTRDPVRPRPVHGRARTSRRTRADVRPSQRQAL